MTIYCRLDNINLSYGDKLIYDKASFQIKKGDQIGVLGLNGSGKSTLFKILAGMATPDVTHGKFVFDKSNGLDDDEFSIFLIPQDPQIHGHEDLALKDYFLAYRPKLLQLFRSLESINQKLEKGGQDNLVQEQKNLLDEFEKLKGWEIQYKYESYLKQFNVDPLKKVSQTSGGELKKALLSVGFSAPENILLWDEPTNHLDINSIKQFEEELASSNKTFLIVSHDRYLLSRAVNKIFKIKHGKIEKYNGTYADYLKILAEEEESLMKRLQKLENGLRRETAWMRQGVKARGTRSKKRVENFHDLRDKVQEIKDKAHRKTSISMSDNARKTKILFEAKDLTLTRGDKTILAQCNFDIYKGNKIGLVGRNGVGKTSLISLLNQTLTPNSGKLKIADDLSIRVFTQKREEMDPEESAFDFIGEGDDHISLPSGNRIHVAGYLTKFNFLKSQLPRHLKTFSGGEKNRLQLAKNLAQGGDIWIFDEPTNDLDLETIEILEETLAKFPGTVIVISHDREFLNNVTDKTWYLDDGKLETFNGGHDQLEEYLDALYVEKNYLSLESENKSVTSNEQIQSKQKPSNKQKMRFKELPNIIQILENEVEELEAKLEKVDYSSMDRAEAEELNKLTDLKEQKEEELLSLYEEKESLDSLF